MAKSLKEAISEPVFMKVCCRCGIEKPSTEFYLHLSTADGRHHYCRNCMNEINRNEETKLRRKLRDDFARNLKKGRR